jgi:hypothetical protein
MKVNVKHRAQDNMGNAKVEAAAGTMTRLITRGNASIAAGNCEIFPRKCFFFTLLQSLKSPW